ncbi:hypothetical protein HAX54_015103 [Datura stramonium]|uniref:Uncharacterized protein n=1 Tax=Datura stramonium TaxID=4076 RepID=A0ABS8TP28_DATST|nr:hypothetical protein [Datura stramonium]
MYRLPLLPQYNGRTAARSLQLFDLLVDDYSEEDINWRLRLKTWFSPLSTAKDLVSSLLAVFFCNPVLPVICLGTAHRSTNIHGAILVGAALVADKIRRDERVSVIERTNRDTLSSAKVDMLWTSPLFLYFW